MEKTKNPDFDAIIQKAVNAGRMQGMSVAKDAYKATERRLYANLALRRHRAAKPRVRQDESH